MKSKLNVLASYADATEGLITHGWITKIDKHGCFVKFYNGVQGFAHRLVYPFSFSKSLLLHISSFPGVCILCMLFTVLDETLFWTSSFKYLFFSY